jgi:alpha-N-acetylglucosamine transferase
MNKEGIVIATSPGRQSHLEQIEKTLDRPHLVVSSYGYELGKIKWVYDHTDWDRFVFLQDSVVITDNSVFDRIWDTPGSICLHHERNHYSCYLGVYERKILDKIDIPVISTKQESVQYEEEWTQPYVRACEELTCFDEPRGSFGQEFEHMGTRILPYTTDYLIKHRSVGKWNDPKVGIAYEQDPVGVPLK